MALSDYPPLAIDWVTDLLPEMLQLLGQLAVMSAGAEELLHQIYWNHAGLDEKTGPIVTENLNPKRLEEDIIKFVSLDKTKANNLADLKILFAEFEGLSTKRNQCLHWIWDADHEDPFAVVNGTPYAYRLKRPLYRQRGELIQKFSTEDVRSYCKQFGWLQQRLRSHTHSDEDLRKRRAEHQSSGPISGIPQADLYWPAPWLDKPLPPAPQFSEAPGRET